MSCLEEVSDVIKEEGSSSHGHPLRQFLLSFAHSASGTQGHQGNYRYRALCHTAATWYHAARGNANLKRGIVNKVIIDVEPGRFLKRQPDGSYVAVDVKEQYTKVQTDLRTGRIGRMMNKKTEIPKEQLDAAVEALTTPGFALQKPMAMDRAVHASRPSNASAVTRTVSSGDDHPISHAPLANAQGAVLAKLKLEAEYLELAKEKEVLVMRNKILELKKDLKGLREYNRQLETGHPRSNMAGNSDEHELTVYNDE